MDIGAGREGREEGCAVQDVQGDVGEFLILIFISYGEWRLQV